MVSHYLCNGLNVLGPTARTDVDTWERVQQRPPGWSGAGAQDIQGKLELGFFSLEKRWLWGIALLSAAPWWGYKEDRAKVFSELHSKWIKFWPNMRNYSSPWGRSSSGTGTREVMHVLPWWYWKPSWTMKTLSTLSWLWLWPCFEQGLG